jgi:endonuclease/exonuclease/phosphatase family metal-dependent hydrolase
MTTVRLMTYNIRSLRDDGDAVAKVIRAARPDVVCIQEAPRFLRWRTIQAGLARRSGMVVVGGGRPAGSNLILSTLAVTVEAQVNVLLTKDPRLHQRGAALAVLRLRSARFAVAGTHLDLEEEARVRHVGELHAALDRHGPDGVPSVVMADVNDEPDTPVWRALAARGRDAHSVAGIGDGFTWSAMDPHKRIDALFVDAGIEIRSAQALHSPVVAIASDHCPVLVEVDVPEA